MERLKLREIIQTNGKTLYERLGETRKDLQYLAGELMTGNEERVLSNMNSPNPLTIGSQEIIDHGFTKNQIIFLESIENLIIKHGDNRSLRGERLLDKEEEIKFVKNARKFCAFCESNEDTIAESVDSEFEYFHCQKCSATWKHPVLTEERIIKKGYLQDQLTKIDALIRDNRELGNAYPNDLALCLNLTGLLNHRNVLCVEIEMVNGRI